MSLQPETTRGTKLLALGLIIGVAIGFSIAIAKTNATRLIFNYMNELVQTSCSECSFSVDKITISILPFPHVVAMRPRILEGKTTKLVFDKLTLKLSPAGLRSKTVTIREIELYGGKAYGVDTESPTFKFIDFLTEPIKPERDYPGRWKARLLQLRAYGAAIEQHFRYSSFFADGISLTLTRQPDDSFTMKSKIRESWFKGSDWLYDIGGAVGDVKFTDRYIYFTKVKASGDGIDATADFVADKSAGNQLTGEVAYSLDPKRIPGLTFSGDILSGVGSLTGTLGNPFVSGTASCTGGNLTLKINDLLQWTASSVKGDFTFTPNRGFPQLKIKNFTGGDPTSLQITASQLLSINDDYLELAAAIKEPSHKIGPARIQDITAEIAAAGKLRSVKTSATGGYRAISVGTVSIPNGNWQATALKGDSTINISDGNTKLNLGFKNGALSSTHIKTEGIELAPKVNLQLNADSTGIFSAGSGLGVLRYGPRNIPLQLTIQDGIITTDAAEADLGGKIIINYPAKTAALKIKSQNFKIYSDLKLCTLLNISGSYDFALQEPLQGEGKIDSGSLRFGCGQPLFIGQVGNTNIKDGVIPLEMAKATTPFGNITLAGALSLNDPSTMQVSGELNFDDTAVTLQNTHELGGALHFNLKPTSRSGTIDFKDFSFNHNASSVSLSNVRGSLELNRDQISIINPITGMLNGGNIHIAEATPGIINLEVVETTFTHPSGTTFGVSGMLSLEPADIVSGTISGQLTIPFHAEKKTSFAELIKVKGQQPTNPIPTQFKLPAIPINLLLTIPDGSDFTGDVGDIRFAGEVFVSGTLQRPVANGAINMLGGWLGTQNRPFDLSSGALIFGGSLQPNIELIAETLIQAPTGELIPITLTGSGGVFSPSIKLQSDRILTQSELIELVTVGRTFNRYSRTNQNGQSKGDQSLLSKLTDLDLLSVEPRLNQQTGAVEPSIVAAKKLSNRLTLRGENSLSANNSYSEVELRYDHNDRLSSSIILEDSASEENSALRFDVRRSIIANQLKNITIIGEKQIDRQTSADIVRQLSSILPIQLDKISDEQAKVANFLEANGYQAKAVELKCRETLGDRCYELELHLSTIIRQIFSGVLLEGPDNPLNIKTERIVGAPASKELMDSFCQELNVQLINLNYLTGRIICNKKILKTDDVRLAITIVPGEPLSIQFVGNKYYSQEVLLKEINLRQPTAALGSNAIKTIENSLSSFYMQRGFLDVNVAWEIDKFVIAEGPRYPFNGFALTETNTIEVPIPAKLLESTQPGDLALILKTIANAYIENGYDNVDVRHQLSLTADGGYRYLISINKGPRFVFNKLEVDGLPLHIPTTKPPTILSVANFNSYVATLSGLLNELGYEFAAVSTETKAIGIEESVQVFISPGERTQLGEVTVFGGDNDTVNAIAKHVGAEYWSNKQSAELRAQLIALGAYTKVDIEESGATRKNLTIYLQKRPPQTLDLGIGVDSVKGLHLFGEGVNRSWFQDGRTVTARADIYYLPSDNFTSSSSGEKGINRGVASVRYFDPNILAGLKFSEELSFEKLRRTTYEFDLERVLLTSLVTKELSTTLRLAISHAFAAENITNVATDAILSEFDSGSLFLSTIGTSLTYSNSQFGLPRFSSTVDTKCSLVSLGADTEFCYSGVRAQGVHALNSSGSIRIAGLSRMVHGYGNSEAIPISQRLYLGGRSSIRGFREDSLGPRGVNSSVLGGETLFANNLELQYSLFETLEVMTFFDLGNVYKSNIDLDLLRYSTGVGLRYLSPIGPIGLELGFPINEEEGEPSVRLHFSAGWRG